MCFIQVCISKWLCIILLSEAIHGIKVGTRMGTVMWTIFLGSDPWEW